MADKLGTFPAGEVLRPWAVGAWRKGLGGGGTIPFAPFHPLALPATRPLLIPAAAQRGHVQVSAPGPLPAHPVPLCLPLALGSL